MHYPHGKIIIFCKAPETGKVKTRLAKSVGDNVALAVHEYLAWHCVKNIVDANLAPVELWCTSSIDHVFFQRCKNTFGVTLKRQVGDDLGERMQYAFADVLLQSEYAVLVGTDCPAIDKEYLKKCFLALDDNADAVIGPAEDGGYVLLGLSDQQPSVFRNMPWGTSDVLHKTLDRLEGVTVTLDLKWDVDRINDLIRLKKNASALPLSADFIQLLDSIDLDS